jgi:predicted Zn-dependent peptidase
MMGMANSLFNYGRIINVDKILSNLEMVTINQIVNVANDIFSEEKLIQIVIANKNFLNKKAA